MKQIFLVALLFFVIPVDLCLGQDKAADSTRAQTYVTDTASVPIKLDIKTALAVKEKSKLAKAGLIAYLKQSDWAEVVNFGEKYSVWIENFRRKLRGNTIQFQLDLELRTQADLGIGRLLVTRHIADTVDLSESAELRTFEEREVYRLVEKKLASRGKLKSLVPTVVGAVAGVALPGPGTLIQNGLKYLGPELEGKYTADEAVEGMVIGATLVTELKAMLDTVRTGK